MVFINVFFRIASHTKGNDTSLKYIACLTQTNSTIYLMSLSLIQIVFSHKGNIYLCLKYEVISLIEGGRCNLL